MCNHPFRKVLFVVVAVAVVVAAAAAVVVFVHSSGRSVVRAARRGYYREGLFRSYYCESGLSTGVPLASLFFF